MVFRIGFRIQKHVFKIDFNSFVSNVMAHPTILHYATVVKTKSEETIKKDVAVDLVSIGEQHWHLMGERSSNIIYICSFISLH